MDIDAGLALLGGLSPRRFMRRYWQRRPLLVRGAWPGARPPLTRGEMFALAGQDDVESRLLVRSGGAWSLRHGPVPRRALPPLRQGGWTLLVQGLDLHLDAARRMLEPFRFVPEARLDDLMVSFATDGGGVGPHQDAYDVFLLQVHGRRRWRLGPVKDDALLPGLPVRILERFEPDQDVVLEPGDLLYLPPMWGHDGIAVGECMTCSVGFSAPRRESLASDLVARLAEGDEASADPWYRDAPGEATATPARVPAGMQRFAIDAVRRRLGDETAIRRALGEALTEPKPRVWFDAGAASNGATGALRLDRRSRMMYDDRHVFLNGESFRARGRDAALMRRLADDRLLPVAAMLGLSADARALVDEWLEAGWLHAE